MIEYCEKSLGTVKPKNSRYYSVGLLWLFDLSSIIFFFWLGVIIQLICAMQERAARVQLGSPFRKSLLCLGIFFFFLESITCAHLTKNIYIPSKQLLTARSCSLHLGKSYIMYIISWVLLNSL